MNLTKNPRKLLMFLILSYGVIIFLTIQILSWTLYMNFDKSGTDIITGLETRNLYLASDNIENAFESARSLCKQIYTDREVKKLMYGIPVETNEANSIIDRVASYTNVSPDIQSIYIYTKKLDYFYCTLSSLSDNSALFFDKELADIVKSLQGKDFNPIPRIIKRHYTNSEITNTAEVYTFILYDYSSDRKSADGAVIVNINAAAVTARLGALASENNSSYMLVDSTMKVVGSSSKDSYLKSMSDDKAIGKIFSNGKASGYLKDTVNHNDSIITYITRESLNWKFIRITPHRSLFSQLYTIRNSTLIISLAILAAALLTMLPIYRNFSPPINKLVNKMQSLEEMRRDNYNTFRQEVLRSLLFESANTNTVSRHFDEFNIRLDLDKKFLLVLIRLDHFQRFCEVNDSSSRNLMLFSIGNVANELVSEKFTCESIQTGPDHLTMILNIDSITDNGVMENVKEVLSRILPAVKEYLKISVSCTVSNPVHKCKDIPVEFTHTLELSNYRLIYGHASVIWASELTATRHRNDFKYSTGKESRLFEQLLLGKPDNAIEIYREMSQYAAHYTYNDLMAFLNSLALSINTFLLKLDRSVNPEINFEFYEFSKSLNGMETLNEIDIKFEALFKEICDSLAVEREEKTDRLVAQIMEYVEENYTDPNLSLNIIAEVVDKSPVYLGRIIKKHTGKSVQDIINEIRLNRAKEQLSKTQHTIQDICGNIGIGNEKYFYIFFKKHTGVTPNEYRSRKQA